MNNLLLGCYMAASVTYLMVRPAWRNVGPSLLDSFILGLSLFAAGSVTVWLEGLSNSEAVMRIGISAALAGTLGASLWSLTFRPWFSRFKFFDVAMKLRASNIDRFTITAGLTVASLVSVWFVAAVIANEHVRALLIGAVFHGTGTLNQARITVSSGAEGYYAPGYVKQFRDVLLPTLCLAAVLCHGTYRNRPLFYFALTTGLASVFVSGQRLVVVEFILGLGCVFLIDFISSTRQRFISAKLSVLMLITMIGLVMVMTDMLGRLDMALSPKVQTAEQETSALLEQPKISTSAPAIAQIDEPPKPEISQTLTSSGVPRPIAAIIAIAHRATIAVPRENTISYPLWASRSPALGAGWVTDLSGMRPGTQSQISNDLSEANGGGPLGNSPLGLATDIYYNWGWLGVALVPPVCAILFLLIDMAAVGSNSPLLFAAKIFLFFSVPLMYSPFMFLLYGGAVVLALIGYVRVVETNAVRRRLKQFNILTGD
ncbi:hypothetical protein [Tardiphaga sp.]|uniref:hypothetical protein n=1 Tax=Tardiphaga sp. TaxID=1926292 RepID=UPI00260555AC|nr:hypothetical protein [Tardiphaga sp.]MDB5620500.1 oligosaccharide repeat unit polymerase [Tardiphaga sp.]